MAANINPIFSAQAHIQGLSGILTTGAADFVGTNVNNLAVFKADVTNGSYLQRLRFKARGTNVTTTARIYICDEPTHLACSIGVPSGTPTGTPSTTGGNLLAGTYYAKVVAVDGYGAESVAGTESAAVTVTGRTGSITWDWAAVAGALKYEIYVGPVSGGQVTMFLQTDGSLNSYTQTEMHNGSYDDLVGFVSDSQNYFYGELLLPVTGALAGSASSSPDIDYPMNIALPPGYTILVGLSATVVGGWEVTGIGGDY